KLQIPVMVVFTCSACNASLRKNQVEKHMKFQCRNFQFVSCIDCQKDFWGNEFETHIKCITEDQKYGGTNYVQKEFKGEKKQEAWINHIQNAVANAKNMNPHVKDLLNKIIGFDNIPRKKPKFENFLKNSVRVKNPIIISQAWEVFDAANKSGKENQQQENNQTNGDNTRIAAPINGLAHSSKKNDEINMNKKANLDEKSGKSKIEKKEKKSKKRKQNHDDTDDAVEDMQTDIQTESQKKKLKSNGFIGEGRLNDTLEINDGSPFKWKDTIYKIVKDAADDGLKFNKLKKKVISEYFASCNDETNKNIEEVCVLFKNKLKSSRKCMLVGDRVKLRKND
ncbi:unnamed protein product, partial [Meganyctiphanes norvegica]